MLVCSECAQEWEWFPFTTQERAPTPPVSVGPELGHHGPTGFAAFLLVLGSSSSRPTPFPTGGTLAMPLV